MTNFLVPVTVNVLPQISELEGKQGMFILPDGSININRKNGTWMIINKQSDHAGVLKPADVPVIQPGDAKWWWAGAGTYVNAGDLVIEKQGILSYDGVEWQYLELDIPVNDVKIVPFDESLFFDFEKEMIHTVIDDIEFKAYDTGLKNGSGIYIRLIADGISNVDFSNFKKMSGSGDYINTNGTLNCLYFFYDGLDVWVNIWQGIGNSVIFPFIPPPTALPIVWNNFVNASINGTNEVLTGTTAESGATLTPFSDTLNGFELIMGASSDIAVLGIHAGNSGTYIWGSTSDLIYGFFRSSGTIQVVKGAGRALIYTNPSDADFARIKRVGNDMVFSTSTDGIGWSDKFTDINGFIGFDTAFIKNTFVAAGTIRAKKIN
jgi:hypothetical protein